MDDEETYEAFFYGTLMAPSVLSRVLNGDSSLPTSHLEIIPAILPNYTRYKILHADYPGIIPTPKSHTVSSSPVISRMASRRTSPPPPFPEAGIVPAHTTGDSNGHSHPIDMATDEEDGLVSRVRGVFVRGLTRMDIRNLDIFEGDQYVRRRVFCRLLDHEGDIQGRGHVVGEEVECETYVFIAGENYLDMSVGEWEFEKFVNEKLYRWADRSEEFADLDNAVYDSEDEGGDPTGGRGLRSDMDNKLKGKEKALDAEVLEAAV